jgi:hypothetical protein
MNNLRESYKIYKEKYEVKVSLKDYLIITTGFMQFMMLKVLDGVTVKLPARLGFYYIKGKKIKPKTDEEGNLINMAPDWVETKKLWASSLEAKESKTMVYHFNEHTNGVRYKIIWSKKNVNVKNKTVYSMQFSRNNKRAVVKSIKNNKEYIVDG